MILYGPLLPVTLPVPGVRMHRIFLSQRTGYWRLVPRPGRPVIGPPVEYIDRPRMWALGSGMAILLLVMVCWACCAVHR